jgi:hypothetical protein
MKTKIKKVFYKIAAGALFLPGAALAQGNIIPECEVVGLPCGDVAAIIENFAKWILGIFGSLAIIAFAIAGILYITAAGDETRIEKAKKMMTYAIIGIIVALIGLIVQRTIYMLLNVQ